MHGLKSAILAILPEIGQLALLVQPSISARRKWLDMVVSASTNQEAMLGLLVIQIQVQAMCGFSGQKLSVLCILLCPKPAHKPVLTSSAKQTKGAKTLLS